MKLPPIPDKPAPPEFPEPVQFKTIDPDKIARRYFKRGIRRANDGSDVALYFDDTFDSFYAFSENNEEEVSDNETDLSVKVFVSRDGAKIRKFALQEAQKIKARDHELLIFIEDNTGDRLTDPICHLVGGRTALAEFGFERAGANVINDVEIDQQDYFDLIFGAQRGQT